MGPYPDGVPTDFGAHLSEIEARVEAGEVIGTQALLGEVDKTAALEGLIGLLAHVRQRLKVLSGR